MIAAASALTARPCSKPVARRPLCRRSVAPRAALPVQEILQLAADAAPGSVDAPVWAIAVGAIVVTAASFAVSAGLKGGTDAAIDMQKRDAKKFNRRDD